MSDNHDAAELEALAANPRTDWDVLHWIAENHPELRPTVAANPGTYQELVDALATLGDPAIDDALTWRHRGREVSSHTAATNPLAGMYDTATQTIDPYQASPDDAGPYYPAETSKPPPPVAPAAAFAHTAAPAPEPYAVRQEKRRRAAPLGLVTAVILGVVGIGAGFALLITLMGGEEDTPVADQSPIPTEEAPAPPNDGQADADDAESGATEPETAEPEGEPALEEARIELASLPEQSGCQAAEDSGVVGEFVTAGNATENFPGDQDTDLLEDTLAQLQDDCSSGHAASVFSAVRGGDAYQGQAPEGAQATMDSVGTEWVDRAVGLRGAERMSGFTAQGGNVECEFDDGVTCTVYNTDPQLCGTGATYRMTMEGVELDCEAQVDSADRETLPVDDSATDGFLVCTEMSDRVSCYNSVEPFGFEMSHTGNYPY